jgi:hypothetical protein
VTSATLPKRGLLAVSIGLSFLAAQLACSSGDRSYCPQAAARGPGSRHGTM